MGEWYFFSGTNETEFLSTATENILRQEVEILQGASDISSSS